MEKYLVNFTEYLLKWRGSYTGVSQSYYFKAKRGDSDLENEKICGR